MNKKHLIYILTILFSITSCATNDSTSTYSSFSIEQESSISEVSTEESSEEIITWGNVTYTWNTAHTEVTATRRNNKDETETETVAATSSVATAATCTADGVRRYTSNAFTNIAFTAQTYDEAISKLGHDLSYVSVDDTNHKHVCSRCDYEVVEEHNYDEGVIQTYAEIIDHHMVLGDILYTCTECGHQMMGKHNHTEFEV